VDPYVHIPKKLVFALATLALGLGSCEAIQRISDWRKEARRAQHAPEAYTLRAESASGLPLTDRRGAIAMAHHPYLVYKPRPRQQIAGPYAGREATIGINAQGFRGRDWTIAKAPGTARLVVLGGSAAFGHGALSDDAVFAAVLERLLRERGRKVEVLNAGVMGYQSTQELVLLATELLDYAPDALLVFDGWNDCFYAALGAEDRGETPPAFGELEAAIADGRALGTNLLRLSALYRGLERKAERWRAARAGGPEDPIEAAFAAEFYDHPAGLARYRANLARICRLARASGAAALLAPQPELFGRADPGPDAAARAKPSASYREHVAARYPGYVAAAREVAAAEGALFRDCRPAFDGAREAVFLDPVHFDDHGNELVARWLLDAADGALGGAGR
jgi:lysophospholipase L1-like esterase